MADKNEANNYNQPVAYDAEGRPLYLRPEDSTKTPPETTVNNPAPAPVDDEQASKSGTPLGEDIESIDRKHEMSLIDYPRVHIDQDEYVVSEIQRSVAGIVIPVGGAILAASVIVTGLIIYPEFKETSEMPLPPILNLILPAFLLLILDGIFVYIAIWVYYRNRIYVTNKCAVGYVQLSLFDRRIHKASLDRIEDVSFHQPGLLASLFNYGKIRMSTIGDESDFQLNFISNPRKQTEEVNDIVATHKAHSPYNGARWRNP